jgi:hypothetical protein
VPPVVSKFPAGSRVAASDSLNIRATAGLAGALLGTQPVGAIATVQTSVPVSSGGFVWVPLNFDIGVDGWAVEDYLKTYVAPTPTPTPTPTPVPTPTPTPTPAPAPNANNKFKLGDQVQTTANLNVRANPGGSKLGLQVPNAIGEVIGGPASNDGLTWWNVNFLAGSDGWVAENYLRVYVAPTSTPTPVPTPTPTPTPTPVPTPTPTPTPTSTFKIGGSVELTRNASIRVNAGGSSIGTQLAGAKGVITTGPQRDDGKNWWRIDFTSGSDGWMEEDRLKVVVLNSQVQGANTQRISLILEEVRKLLEALLIRSLQQ